TGFQLHHLFVTILVHCHPVDPHVLWEESRANLCDDLHHCLIHHLHIENPTEEQIFDYGLH
ncbi:hypothetical protein PISMIDRAFT_51255, partial [Pisolithus microcarpus 441]